MISVIIALIFIFLPGYMLSRFYKVDKDERLILSVAFSITLITLMGFLLGGNKSLKQLTGGYTFTNIFVFLTILTVAFWVFGKWKR